MKEHWITKWHRESNYRLAEKGSIPCRKCDHYGENSGRCGKHGNCKVSGVHTCKDSNAGPK